MEFLTTKGRKIDERRAEKEGLTLCTKIGQYIDDNTFVCDKICSDCIYFGDNKDNNKNSNDKF